MALPERRLARLERRRTRRQTTEERQLEARRKCDNGTASIAEMALVLGGCSDRFLEETVVPIAPMVVAMERAGISLYTVLPAVAYPPGEALPEEVVGHLEYMHFLATYTVEDRKMYCRHSPSWQYHLNRLFAVGRELGFPRCLVTPRLRRCAT